MPMSDDEERPTELLDVALADEIELVSDLVVAASTTARHFTPDEVDALLGSVAADHGLPFVAVGDWLTKYGLVQDLADSVHMNPGGRRALGTLLERRLRELGLERTPTADVAPLLDARTGGAGAGQD